MEGVERMMRQVRSHVEELRPEHVALVALCGEDCGKISRLLPPGVRYVSEQVLGGYLREVFRL